MTKGNEKLRKKVARLGLDHVRRHIFICNDTKQCNCASESQMKASWKFLKKRLKELGREKTAGVMYSRTRCLDVCTGGPIAVVYPEGIWYGGCTEDVLEAVIQRHLIMGEVVSEHVIARPPGGSPPGRVCGD